MYFNRCTIKGNNDIKVGLQELAKTLPLKGTYMNTSKLDEVCEFSN